MQVVCADIIIQFPENAPILETGIEGVETTDVQGQFALLINSPIFCVNVDNPSGPESELRWECSSNERDIVSKT